MKRIKKRRAFELCWNERRALAVVDSPFAVGLKYAFHDAESSRLVLVIDLMMGGDLKYWLSQHKCFGFEASRYYAARTLLGLKALHDRDFVYRDVKPENMLVDEHGRVRLSDLGLACRVRSRAEINQ
jgi:serine/threonine protein kinase